VTSWRKDDSSRSSTLSRMRSPGPCAHQGGVGSAAAAFDTNRLATTLSKTAGGWRTARVARRTSRIHRECGAIDVPHGLPRPRAMEPHTAIAELKDAG